MINMNSSPMPRGIPRQGSVVAPMSPDQDIAALLSQITGEDSLSSDEPTNALFDDIGDIEDLEKIVGSLPPELAAPQTGTDVGVDDLNTIIDNLQPESHESTHSDPEFTDDLIDSDDGEERVDNNEDSDSIPVWKNYKKQIIAIAAIFFAIILAGVIAELVKNKKPTQNQQSSLNADFSTGVTFYADQVSGNDTQTYQDSMTIEKYIVMEKDSCVFVFSGYAENARAFVTAYVDIDTYNLYKTGARVPILYEHIVLNDKDYYMKVRVNR